MLSVLVPPAALPVVIEPDLVRLDWSTWLLSDNAGIVEVSRDGSDWTSDGKVITDAQGHCTFEGRSVTPGSTVQYRLREMVYLTPPQRLGMVSGVTTVHVPTPLTLAGLRPNPSHAAPAVAFTLSERAATRLEVYDVAGRRVWARDLGVLEPGPHLETVGPGDALRSGVFVFRLVSGARSLSVRGVIAR